MQKKMKVKIQGEIEVICTPVEDAPVKADPTPRKTSPDRDVL